MTADPAERVQMLTAGGRVLRVATRDGDPDWPPLLLCNGIGGRLELFQPFVDALDPRRGVIRFDMPGIGQTRPRPCPTTWPPLYPSPVVTLVLLNWHVGATKEQALAAQMPRITALIALAALGLSGAPAHEPVHAWRHAIPMTVTQRDTIEIRRS